MIEYIDGFGTETTCPGNSLCMGCYGTYTCPMCVGSDLSNRFIRKTDGTNDCTCSDGYYDDSPTELDC